MKGKCFGPRVDGMICGSRTYILVLRLVLGLLEAVVPLASIILDGNTSKPYCTTNHDVPPNKTVHDKVLVRRLVGERHSE